MNIAVYLASQFGKDPEVEKETEALGTWIGENHHTLVYGGSKTGLMFTIADSTIHHGGKVIGIEAKQFYEEGCSYLGCAEFHVTDTLMERKKMMMDLSDAFIALPGGTGTLDEISEIMCLDKLSTHHRPIILLNIHGFYDDLRHQLDKMVEFGYLARKDRNLITFSDNVEEAVKILEKADKTK